MKKTLSIFTILSLFLGLLFTSCVSNKKMMESQAQVEKLQKENAATVGKLDECGVQVKKLNETNTFLKDANQSVQNDFNDLTKASKLTIADQAKRLKRLQDIVQSQKTVMNNLKNSIADALMNYSTDELNVNIKDGKVYVSLEEKLLFKSGSDVVDKKGKEALKALAKILNATKDINVMIEGHTDNVPIKTKQFEDNWDLSTARATSIVRILIKDNGLNPTRITASGKSDFQHLKTNDTPQGRASNRRTEVILTPDLKEMFILLDQ